MNEPLHDGWLVGWLLLSLIVIVCGLFLRKILTGEGGERWWWWWGEG